MTEQEMGSFLRYANRPGKRRIRPTKMFYELPGEENSEDDEDFALASEAGDSEENSGSGSDDGSEEGESESDNEEGETSDSLKIEDESNQTEDKPEKKQPDICCICLGTEKPGLSLCKCDRCHIIVHEACYGIIDDEADSVSSGNDVPWFCEPCMFGLVEPPYCEMCPNRFGAFKKTDIGGNWIHLICAHYIEKTSFADVEKFQGASYQEIDFKQFGRKPCHGCTDPLEARVGIAVQCESGLCKNFYHPTCAQKNGFLVPMDDHETDGHLLCKKHSLPEEVKVRKKKFEIMMTYENKRMIGVRRRKPGPDEERRRQRQYDEYNKRMAALEGVNVLHPGPNNVKRQRLIQSSAELIEGFAAKAEMTLNINRERFIKEFTKIAPENLNLGGEISFSEDSIRYIEYRETVLFDEYEQYIEEAKVTKEECQEKLDIVTAEFREIEDKHKKIIAHGNDVKEDAIALIELLQEFGAKGVSKACLKLPKSFPVSPNITQKKSIIIQKKKVIKPNVVVPVKVRKMPVLKPVPRKTSPEVITLSDDDDEPPELVPASSVSGRKSAPDGVALPKLTKIERKINLSLGCLEEKHLKSKKIKKNEPNSDIPAICHTCKKEDNPKIMPFCDSCNHFYHLGCLDPPLDKLPKTSKFYKWTCADCNEKEDEPNTSNVNGTQESDEENQSLAQRKKQRERAMAIRVAREAEMNEIYSEKKRRSSYETPVAKKKKINQNLEMNIEENGYHDE